MKQRLNRKKAILMLLALSIAMLMGPHLIRYFYHGPVLMGEEPYYHLRAAEKSGSSLFYHDELSYSGIPALTNPYHILLKISSFLLPLHFASASIPLILGVMSVFLFYHNLKSFGFTRELRFMGTVLLAISPTFIYLFTISNPHSLAIFLNLAAFYLFTRERSLFLVLSLMIYMIIPSFGLVHAAASICILAGYSRLCRKKAGKMLWPLLVLVLVSLVLYGLLYSIYGMPDLIINSSIIQSYVFALGGITGFSVFAMLLSLIGLILTWRKKRRFIVIYISLLVFLFFSLFTDYSQAYSVMMLSMLAAYGLSKLIKMEWKLDLIRDLSLIMIMVGLFIPAVNQVSALSSLGPSQDMLEALSWLKENSLPSDIVFSHPSRGFWIEQAAGRKTLLDNLYPNTNEYVRRKGDSDLLFSSRNLRTTSSILSKYNITYIFIDREMKDIVWASDDAGLLFLFRNNETFKNRYNHTGIEIWEFIRPEKEESK